MLILSRVSYLLFVVAVMTVAQSPSTCAQTAIAREDVVSGPANATTDPDDALGESPAADFLTAPPATSPQRPATLTPEPTSATSFEKLIQLQSLTRKIILQSTPAVVAIDQTGSGVVVSPDGIVLTASHVTRIANRKVSVAFSDGRIVQGITLGSNLASDTGAIQLMGAGPFAYVPVQDSQSAAPGSWCITMGYPLSFPRGKPAAGRLGRLLSREASGKLVTDCTIMGGDSGGPLLNLDGKVIAISSSVKLGIDQNLFIPSEQFIKDWQNIAMSIDRNGPQSLTTEPPNAAATREPQEPVENITPNQNILPDADQPNPNQPNQPNQGFRITKRPPAKPSLAKPSLAKRSQGKAYLGINAETDRNFVRIRAVHRQSPAQRAGIQPNDVIVALDDSRITSFSQIVKALKKRSPGDKTSVVINRYGSVFRTQVTLGGASAN